MKDRDDTLCFVSLGPRSRAILEKLRGQPSSISVRSSSLVLELPTTQGEKLAENILEGVALVSSCSADTLILLVDGFSSTHVKAARLIAEKASAISRVFMVLVPPYPYENRLQGMFWYHAGLLAAFDSDKKTVVISIKYDDLLDANIVEFEEVLQTKLAEAVLDLAGQIVKPPVSTLLSEGSFMLVVGSYGGPIEHVLSEHLETRSPGVVVTRDSKVSELIDAATVAMLIDENLDFTSGGASYLIIRSDALSLMDPLHKALGDRVLDSSPSLPGALANISFLYSL